MLRNVFIVIFLILSPIAKADYRVFLLQITDTKTNSQRTLQSTLDPLQYKTIYPLSQNQAITYVDTWKCKGNTSFYKILCAKSIVNISKK